MAFNSSLLTAEWLNTPHQCRQPFHQLLHRWVFARVDGTLYHQRAHRDGVEAVRALRLRASTSRFLHALTTLPPWFKVNARKTSSHQLPEKLRRELRVQNDGRGSTLKKACQQLGRTGESRARYAALANHLPKRTRATRVMQTRWTRNCSNHSILQIYMVCQPGKTTAREALLFTCFLL